MGPAQAVSLCDRGVSFEVGPSKGFGRSTRFVFPFGQTIFPFAALLGHAGLEAIVAVGDHEESDQGQDRRHGIADQGIATK